MQTLCPEVEEYFRQQKIDTARLTRADVVLAFLRLNRLEEAQELAGVTITKCPDYIPPWPPRPVQRAPRGAVVSFKMPNKSWAAGMGARWKEVRVGMTRDQLLARGVTTRDLKYWAKANAIRWSSDG